jgi:putative membrane protein
MSFFGNAIWLLTTFIGFASYIVFGKEALDPFYITLGMCIFACFRIGILTTTLGIHIGKAWAMCFLQPLAMFFVFVPSSMWTELLSEQILLVYGGLFLATSTIWSLWTDKAGRPWVQSTHKLLQAYLSAMSTKDPTEMEAIIEPSSKRSSVTTSQIKFQTESDKNHFRMVLPEIHPGPFHPVGGSNIPYLIYKNMDSSAMVMHSVSNHALNLPNQEEVQVYLESLSQSSVTFSGTKCTEPVIVQINKARCAGILFEKTAVLFLSLSPHGMEDIPISIRTEIEQFAKNRNFERIMVIDCHNAMGEEINKNDGVDMLTAAKSTLDSLKTKESHQIKFSYANSLGMEIDTADIAKGGIGILCLEINSKKYYLGWADANNMENGLREQVVEHFSNNGYELIEICTSDTHYTSSGVRNKNGYFQLGIITKPTIIANWYLHLAKQAEKNVQTGKFEILENQSDVKVMGPSIFESFSTCLDNALRITKGVLIGGLALFITTIFL